MFAKNKSWVIQVLILCFLGSLLFALFKQFKTFEKPNNTEIASIPEYFDYGSVADSMYCNDFFGFRIKIPDGYTGEYKRFDYIEKSIYERDSVPAAPKLTSNITNQNLLIIRPEFVKMDPVKMILHEKKSMEELSNYFKKKTQRERFGADHQIQIGVHRLSDNSLNSYTSQFQNMHHPNYRNSQVRIVSGVSFQELHGIEEHGNDAPGRVMFRMLGGKNRNIISLATIVHDFALSIDLFYQTEEQKRRLLELVDTISFH